MTKEWDHMQHVFISYKNEDLDFADNVISRLEREGFTTWSDLKIGAGEEWRNSIDLAIKNAFALIVIMTPEAKASEYVTYEWAFAWGVGIRVIPIMLRTTELHPRLEALQYLDFTNLKSRPWDRLIEEVRDASHAPLPHSVSIPLNSPPFIRQAVASLDSAVLDDRRAAIVTLAAARTPAACDVLREALKHPLPDVRSAAAGALGGINDPAAVPGLMEALGDISWEVRSAAAGALGKINDPAAVPGLMEALGDISDGVRSVAAEALRKINDPAAVPGLMEALGDISEEVRWTAAEALGRMNDPAAVPRLMEALKDPSREVRSAADGALRAIRERSDGQKE
jgi:TIR domain/HEAT repeats